MQNKCKKQMSGLSRQQAAIYGCLKLPYRISTFSPSKLTTPIPQYNESDRMAKRHFIYYITEQRRKSESRVGKIKKRNMCLFKKRKVNDRVKALDTLQRYVQESDPIVNMQLRNNIANDEEISLLDSLFTDNNNPKYLYRWLPTQYVTPNDNMLIDKGYLSCSKNIDDYISHVIDNDVACYRIETYEDLKTIDVCTLLPNHNNEGEFILPRELALEIVSDKVYQQSDFSLFLRDIDCYNIRDNDLRDHYQSIRLLELIIHR